MKQKSIKEDLQESSDSSSSLEDEEEQFSVHLQAKSLLSWGPIICQSKLFGDVYLDITKLVKETEGKFGIPFGRALLFLSKNNYNKLLLSFVSDEQQLNSIFPESTPKNESTKNLTECLLCFDNLDASNKHALSCNHFFCDSCFSQYISCILITDGRQSIFKTCPMEGCLEIVGENEFSKYLDTEKFSLYRKFIVNDVIDKSPNIFACPAINCSFVQFSIQPGSTKSSNKNKNVTCKCEYEYCGQCKEKGHFPCVCDDFKKWVNKIDGEIGDEFSDWLFMNTKKCPKCFVSIEKNQGCMHMTCKQCQFHFCWICVQAWSGHNDYYSCSRLDKAAIELEENRKKDHSHFKFHQRQYLTHQNNVSIVESEIKSILDNLNKVVTSLETNNQKSFEICVIEKYCKLILSGRKLLPFLYAKGYFISEREKLEFFSSLIEDYTRIIDKYNEYFNNLKDIIVVTNKKKKTITLKKDFTDFMEQIASKIGSVSRYITEKMKQFSEGLDQFESNKTKQNMLIPANSEIVYQKKKEKISAKEQEKRLMKYLSQNSSEPDYIDLIDAGEPIFQTRIKNVLMGEKKPKKKLKKELSFVDQDDEVDIEPDSEAPGLKAVSRASELNQNIGSQDINMNLSQEYYPVLSQAESNPGISNCIDCGLTQATTEYGVCDSCFETLNN